MKNLFTFKPIKNCIKITISTILALSFMVFAFGCAPDGSAINFSYFNTYIHIESHNKMISKADSDKISALLKNLDEEYSTNKVGSFINRFNNSKKGEIIPLTEQQLNLLELSSYCNKTLSKGAFNPSVYPLSVLWKFTDNKDITPFVPPTDEQVKNTLTMTDFSNVVIDKENKTITKNEDYTTLDFGGMLKGYACDKVAEILISSGHTKGYIDIGGSSLTLLNVEKLSIRHPRPDKDHNLILELNTKDKNNLAISTSGDYEKYHDYNGKRYSHIIDPFTGYPVDTGICSVTITGISGIYADALSTAICVYGHTPQSKDTSPVILYMKDILSHFENAKIYAVYDKDGVKEILTNEKENKNFVLLDNRYTVYNF